MIQLNDALQSLSAIHAQLAKGEVYRGLRARPVFVSGLLGLSAVLIQTRFFSGMGATGFVWYWLAAGATSGLIGASGGIISYCLEEDESARRRTRAVAGQFIPCLAVGAFVPLALLPVLGQCAGLLPGIWALVYCLGLFSVRPYLPHATGWVGLYFFVVGILLTTFLSPSSVPSPWAIGAVFAVGQFALAWVLHQDLSRESEHG